VVLLFGAAATATRTPTTVIDEWIWVAAGFVVGLLVCVGDKLPIKSGRQSCHGVRKKKQ
jgi:hypothetical protein